MPEDSRQQQIATRDVRARQLVLAGPGTGKTQIVALRLSHLLARGVGPGQILLLSFSRGATRTVVDRLERFAANSKGVLDDLRHVSIRTFDSWTFRLLRQLGDLPHNLFKRSYDGNIDHLARLISGERREDIRGRLDAVRHLIIDEFQDLSGVRGRLVLALLDLLAPPEDDRVGFTILGDEAQAIYGFALRNQTEQGLPGITTAELLAAVRGRYSQGLHTTNLETNYRAVPGLASLAVHLRRILARPTRNVNKLDAIRRVFTGVPLLEHRLDPGLASGMEEESMAILTRTNGEAIRVWQLIMGDQVEAPPVRVKLHSANQISRVPAWVGATLGPVRGATISRQRFGRVYARLYGGDNATCAAALGIPDEATAWLRLVRAGQMADSVTAIDLHELRSRLSWPDLFPDDQYELDCPINIMTVHQSKGREFDNVSIVQSIQSDSLPHTEDAILEEASVIFVAVTRAGKTLRRIPSGNLPKLRVWKCGHESRLRWGLRADSGLIHLEMGLQGDVSATSFVDTRVHGSEQRVVDVQQFLAWNASALLGRKVMLCRTAEPGYDSGHIVYAIHLQEGTGTGRLLGVTARSLTFDLLGQLNGLRLPEKIYNLRIVDVVTFSRQGDETGGLALPWNESGFWLGVNIYGTGDFKADGRPY